MEKLMGYLRLMRVPNIITAISDVLAGVAIAGSFVFLSSDSGRDISYGQVLFIHHNTELLSTILLFVLATIGLYGGGVVLNDVFDAELDKIERPERPIPSGLISKTAAAIFGTGLLIMGVMAAALTQWSQFFSAPHIIAFSIAVAAVVYDKWMKHHGVLGPLNMGICRGLNLLLGMSILPFAIQTAWYLAIIPVVYIAAITMISRGEVHGGKKNTMYFAFALYSLVILCISAIAYNNSALPYTIPFQLIHVFMVFTPLLKAVKDPRGPVIGKAVKNGVIGLIAMNASFAAAHNDLYFAILIILLLPLSILLARLFAVT